MAQTHPEGIWEQVSEINFEKWFSSIVRYYEHREDEKAQEVIRERSKLLPAHEFLREYTFGFTLKKDITMTWVSKQASGAYRQARVYLFRSGDTQGIRPHPSLSYCELMLPSLSIATELAPHPNIPAKTTIYFTTAYLREGDPLERIWFGVVGTGLGSHGFSTMACRIAEKKAADLKFDDLRIIFSEHFSFDY